MTQADAVLRSNETGEWIGQDDVREVQRFDEFSTIDWLQDELNVHQSQVIKARTGQFKTWRDKATLFSLNWLVLTLIGMSIGVIASCLNIMTAWLSNIRVGHCSGAFHLSRELCCATVGGSGEGECLRWIPWFEKAHILNYFIYLVTAFVFLFTAAIIVKKFAPSAAGSGISEIKCIVSGFVMNGFLEWSTLIIKSIGLPLAIGSGLSLGKEGPSVHYAVCTGNCISKLFKRYQNNPLKSKEFLTAALAAGVAVAFGSPMGGVLFSMEEISSVFELSTISKSYFCALVAVGTLAAINPFGTGQLVIFEITYDTSWHYFEIPFYILLGVFGGVYGILVSKFNKRVVRFRKKYLGRFAIEEAVTLAILTALFCYFNQFLRSDMTETMQILFHECGKDFDHPMCDPEEKKKLLFVSLIFATIARCVLTIFTYGCKVPAGIFVPSMAAGATFGRALGIVMEALYQSHPKSSVFSLCPATGNCIIPGTYAFLGAAAALSGITHLTVTVVVIMFELTGALRYVIPTMIVVAVTKRIIDKWGEGGIADQMIKFNGLPFLDVKEVHHFHANVPLAMSPVTVVLPSGKVDDVTIKDLAKILKDKPYKGYPVIHSFASPTVVGYVLRSDLQYIIENSGINEIESCDFIHEQSPFAKAVYKSPITVSKDTTLEYLLEIFSKMGPRIILVEDQGLLVGIITRKDLLRYENTVHNSLRDNSKEIEYANFDAQVWGLMLYANESARKFFGKLLFNNESRFL